MSDFDERRKTANSVGHDAELVARAWWADPQMLIAVAALVTSIVAVATGAYSASLQRQHDRAEVWPHLEVGLWESPQGVAVQLSNTGIGPARIESVDVSVNGKPMVNWDSVIVSALGTSIPRHNQVTVVDGALRAGDNATLLGIGAADLPSDWRTRLASVAITICYTSVFGQTWVVTKPKLGGASTWVEGGHCVKKAAGDF